MKILVINSGSSSLKYQLFNMDTDLVLARGIVERIGESQGARYTHRAERGRLSGDVDAPDHEAALAHMVTRLIDPDHGAVASVDEIDAVGHRVVHGGERFIHAAEINDDILRTIETLAPLAPLHNPPNLAGIIAARHHFAGVPHVAVFDTAFHQTMPPHAFHYGLPYEFYEKQGLRRYGFHGTSHLYVARTAAAMLGKELSDFSGITCHLGNGCSIAAVKNGESVDTSMGLTPLEGLLMGTRSGDIDPAIVFFLAREAKVPFEKIENILNKKSGLLGVSGVSNDVRIIRDAAEHGNPHARLALDIFAYRVKKYIGAYLAVLNGCDAVIFTGGIGENDIRTREKICSGLQSLGVRLDPAANKNALGAGNVISAPQSLVKLLVIPTNEELEIARETAPFVRAAQEQFK